VHSCKSSQIRPHRARRSRAPANAGPDFLNQTVTTCIVLERAPDRISSLLSAVFHRSAIRDPVSFFHGTIVQRTARERDNDTHAFAAMMRVGYFQSNANRFAMALTASSDSSAWRPLRNASTSQYISTTEFA